MEKVESQLVKRFRAQVRSRTAGAHCASARVGEQEMAETE